MTRGKRNLGRCLEREGMRKSSGGGMERVKRESDGSLECDGGNDSNG